MSRYEVLIVGGGIAGSSLAYELAPHVSVGLLEMEGAFGFHSTGRSAGFFVNGDENRTLQVLIAASRPFFEGPPEGFGNALIHKRPMCWVASKSGVLEIRNLLGRVAEFSPHAAIMDASETRRVCPVLNPAWLGAGLLDPDAGDIDVDAVHQGFLRGVRRHGGDTYLNASVIQAKKQSQSWSILTKGGERLEAEILVNAAGAWADDLARLAGVHPLRLQVMARNAFIVNPPGLAGFDFSGWPMVHDLGGAFYFKPEGGGLLCSPADEIPSVPENARPDEESIARGIRDINCATRLDISRVRAAWAGLRTFAKGRTPIACFDRDVKSFFWLVGQGGSGIGISPALARAAAAEIVGRELPTDLVGLGLDRRQLSVLQA